MACPHCGFLNKPGEKFCGGCGKPAQSAASAGAPAPIAAPAPASAPAAAPAPPPGAAMEPRASEAAPERRQLTVMFCDLVGSTALSERLDPEELRDVIRGYQQTAADVIARFDGHIAQYLGDGLLVYFGYPQAHEDNALRAVNAGIGIIAALADFKSPVPNAGPLTLSARVGIHSGAVVVGEVGDGARQERLALGDTPNIAARIQGLAQPDTVVVGESTYRLIEGLYVCEDLGPQQLKGISHPVRVYHVLHESGLQSRFEAKAERGLVQLVAREEEVGLLLKRWQQAAEGEGQAILLSGESGIGKSRVLKGFQDLARNELKNRVLYHCSPYHRDTPYYPVIEQLERSLRFSRTDNPEQKMAKLEAQMSEYALPLERVVPPLAALLAVQAGDRYASLAPSPEDRKKRTVEAILLVIEAMAARDPVLMVVEDMHWIDPSTMDLLKLITEWLANKRILLIGTHRLEFVPSWNMLPHITSIKLSRLGRRASMQLISAVTGGKALPAEVLDHILERTDGVPLFVEELTKTVLESGLMTDTGERYVLSGPLPPHAIPLSLQDSLMARLDRLAPVKEIAQLAATLGRHFTQDLLAAVSRLAEDTLRQALEQLINAELVYRRGLAPDVIYEFKHALVQDVAYNSLLRSKRQELHVEIARILESQFPDTVTAKPELLSHHYKSAALPERAIPYSIRAGDVAASRYASAEATVHYQAALDMASQLAPSAEAGNARVQAVLKLASVAARREHFERDLQNLEGVRQLAESGANREQLCRILYWTGRMHFVLGDFDRGVDYAQQALRVAESLGGDDSLSAEPINLLARIHCLRGEPALAVQYAERNVGQMHRLDNRIEEAAVSGVLAFACGMHGRYREAIGAADHGVAIAKGLEHLPTLAACYMYRAVVKGWFGRIEDAAFDFEQALAISERSGDLFRRYLVHGWRGEAYVLCEDYAAAGKELAQCIALGDQIGTSFHRGAFLAFVARVRLHEGDLDAARRAVDEAVRAAVETRQPWGHSIALRVQSEIMRSASPQQLDAAEAAVRAAIDIQVARECRCDLGWSRVELGRVLQAKGDFAAALAELVEANREFEALGIARGIEKVSAVLAAANETA